MNGPDMELVVDRGSQVSIYRQIVQQIRDKISSGELGEGVLLPPERRLARTLGVNRSTVLSAYRELKRDGLVEARVGHGTTVLPRVPPRREASERRALPWRQLFRERGPHTTDPLVRDLLALSERDDVISLSVGMPAPDLLPIETFRELMDELLTEIGPPSLLHCPTEGHAPLRETLSRRQNERGIACRPGEVLLLSGSQQGLDLAARAFLEPGDSVIVEEPSFFGALQAFRAAQARLIGVPTDDDGMCTDVLAALLERHRPKLIYTLPTYQNPSGAVMSLARRRHLLELAHRHQIPIVEDDPYSDLRYDGDPLPSLKALDDGDLVLRLSTASKVLFPGLRLGWLVAPRPVVHQFALLKQSMDLHTNTLGQWLLDRFLRQGHYDRHLDVVRAAYARRRDLMHESLSRDTPPGLTWKKPDGGFYIWCRLPEDVERSRLLARATETGVSFLPGWYCFPEDPGTACLRLTFSFPQEDEIVSGISRILDAVRHGSNRSRTTREGEVGIGPIV